MLLPHLVFSSDLKVIAKLSAWPLAFVKKTEFGFFSVFFRFKNFKLRISFEMTLNFVFFSKKKVESGFSDVFLLRDMFNFD